MGRIALSTAARTSPITSAAATAAAVLLTSVVALAADPPAESAAQLPALPTPPTPPALSPAVAPADDRLTAYRMFREHFSARRFTEAQSAAQQVVEISEKRFGSEGIEMVVPLTNLATTQVRLQEYLGAERNYQRAVKIVEMREGAQSRRILNPLLGLGALYYAAQQFDNSVKALRRAVDTSRKLDGLFNTNQVNLVQALIETYVALDMVEDAEREQQYALRLSESVYGPNDLRILPALDKLATWREFTGRYRLARQAHVRALDLVRRKAGKRDPRIVNPLRGIARTYRMEFLYGSFEDEEHLKSMSASMGSPISASPILTTQEPRRLSGRLDPDGEDALKLAIGILEEIPDAAGMKGETLLDLGDWYQLASDQYDAVRVYKQAWEALAVPGGADTDLMANPVQLYFKAPGTTKRRESTEEREIVQHHVELTFTVRADGRVADVRTVSSDPPEQVKSLEIALRRARYRPRFVDGAPVESRDQRISQTLYLQNTTTGT